jgi:hypothetical protein
MCQYYFSKIIKILSGLARGVVAGIGLFHRS